MESGFVETSGRRLCFNYSSARRPCPQVPQWHPRVAKGTFIDPLAREPSTEPLLGQGHVARLSGTGVKPVSCRCLGRTSARHPRREASRWHHGVAKGTSIDPSARGPSTKPLLGQGHVARLSGTGVKPVSCRCFGRTSARHPRREASWWHPGVARQPSIGSSSIKCRYSMDIVVRVAFFHKMPLFHGRCLDPSPRLFRGLFYPTDFNSNFLTVNSFGKLKQLTIATDTLTAVRGTLKTSHIADYQAPIKPCHYYYRCLS